MVDQVLPGDGHIDPNGAHPRGEIGATWADPNASWAPISSRPAAQPAMPMAIVSLVLGIVSLAVWWYPLAAIVAGIPGFGFGIVSIILSPQKRVRAARGLAVAGIICSLIGLALSMLLLFNTCSCGNSGFQWVG